MQRMTTRKVCDLAREFDGVSEKDHFGSDAFCANGRIFATVWHDKNRVTLMLDQDQQRAFLSRDGSEGFITMDNAWGKNAIGVDLDCVDSKIFVEALREAWMNSKNKRSAPKKKTDSKPAASAGYSGTPLGKKLGIKSESSIFLCGMPASVRKGLGKDLSEARVLKSIQPEIDLIHAFVSSKADLKKGIGRWKKNLSKSGALWVSWPKKTSAIKSDLSGDLVREIGLASGLVDIKVCAVDEDWSGLKFVYRKSDR